MKGTLEEMLMDMNAGREVSWAAISSQRGRA